MNKEELLQEISYKISTGEISREEVISRFGLEETVRTDAEVENSKSSSSFSATKMLYILGAAIVVIGIVIFVHQIWYDISSFGRITLTLGLGYLITIIGSMLLKNEPENTIGSVFHFIGGTLIPWGTYVTLYELNLLSDWIVAATFGVIFVFYLLLNLIHKSAILTFFAIANGTLTVYLVLNAIVGGPFDRWAGIKDIYQYTTMALGVSYLSLAHAFRGSWNRKLVGFLCFFGSTGFLGASFLQVFDSALWEMLYFIIVIGGIALSVYMRSRSVLVMSTLFLIAHVSYITSEYFANSLGWPISLVVLGFVFIGLGYVSININKKYIAN
jgi:hypothetical protein